MNKTLKRIIAISMVLLTIFSMISFASYAVEESFEVEAPKIEIKTNKSKYGLMDVADVYVTVYPTSEYPIENVSVATFIDNQLLAVQGGEFYKETDMLNDDGITLKYQVALSKKASKLNFFQKIYMFFMNLFKKKIKTTTISEQNFEDDRTIISVDKELYFSSIKCVVTAKVWYSDEIENEDSDGDKLIDYIEKANGLNPNLYDTDDDGLNDYDEFVIIGTNPLLVDTDDNGINDYYDDNDGDGLSNGSEVEFGTSANSKDTDSDALNDDEELEIYNTYPTEKDTDGDGASDGWEIENDYDPNWYDDSFDVIVEYEMDDLIASVDLSIHGENVETVNISPVNNDALIDDSIPGYIDNAVEITAKGDIGIAKICFEFDESLLDDPDFVPAIYCLNEEKQAFYEYETKLYRNVAVAQSTHFSKYILLNKNVYERHLKETYAVDYSKDNGVDSNNDGISDYVTKLMCDGVIRTGTGIKIFGDFTYEEVQSNDDIDGDGIINGDEITIDYSYIDVPEDAAEYNGHYYKIYDVGYIWDDAEAYCESIGGYLVTVTSKEEQATVEKILTSGTKNSYWLGAQKRSGSWNWASGEAFDYTKWATGQPDNHCENEETLMIYRNKNPFHYGTNSFGYWNDLLNDGTCNGEEFFGLENFGFICEWGSYEVNSHKYAFINSSPIHGDTDKDGFVDAVDPTPNEADVFASMTHYKKYYYDDVITVSVFARQPVWNSRLCYSFSAKRGFNPYFTDSGSGHSFLGIDDENENQDYFGYYGNDGEASSGDFEIAIFKKKLSGFVRGELYSGVDEKWNHRSEGIPIFTIGKTFAITDEQLKKIYEYCDDHQNDKYVIDSNNCTTFAIKAIKYAGVDAKINEHNWTRDGASLEWIANRYYGYSPSDVCQDIRENYSDCIACRSYTLKDGTDVIAYELIQK